ncbi:hypothetical protein [Vibrio sp. RE88]|uniref:hypothetical protein n=1 Tax=Vibrio sp. RE88 TaxID=2607610 RepID=UPI001493B64A|nr:hypothetical protein [Vibrio sp. RE88]NOH60280.1 hypothetical protein [Vibrio sp. RE88]
MYKVTKNADNSISIVQYIDGEILNSNDYLVEEMPKDRGERDYWDIDIATNKIFVRAKTDLEIFQLATLFFDEEKKIALRIEEDYRLGLLEITEQEMNAVKSYIQEIRPRLGVDPKEISRPEIMSNAT